MFSLALFQIHGRSWQLPFRFGSADAWAIPRATLIGVFIGNGPNIFFASAPAKRVSAINLIGRRDTSHPRGYHVHADIPRGTHGLQTSHEAEDPVFGCSIY